jgi:hypothetical protein
VGSRVGRRRKAAAFLALALLLTACRRTQPAHKSPSVATSSAAATTPLQTGFGGLEYFCAQQPLTGEIRYDSISGQVSMDLAVHGLPAQTFVLINWSNNTVRGYAIGTFSTGADGASIPSSLHLFRPGEERGYQILLTTAATVPEDLGVLWPCGSPSRAAASIVDDPAVSVSPNTGLHDGQVVRVSVTGFGANGKAFISECDHAEDANYLGCGSQLAAQPFVVTNAQRSGSIDYTVRSEAPSEPLTPTAREPCLQLCVIVAESGDGAWAVAPIAFGSAQLVNP